MSQSAAQICADAAASAKMPGATQLAGRKLNLVLNDLVLHRDLKMNRILAVITAQAGSNGPFPLETGYLRTYDLFFLQNNIPYFLYPVSQEQFDQEFKDPSIANYPYEYATDLSPISTAAGLASNVPGNLYIYPQSTSQLALQHRYMIGWPDIVTPESNSGVPWFPDQDYLTKATATKMMEITDDARMPKWIADCESMLRTHLIMEGDEQKVVKEVRLDPRRFRTTRGVKPTKITG